MPDPAAHVTRVGTTPTLAVHPASQELDRPIHRSITCHSAIQVVSPKCPWPPHPAPCHSVLKTRINSQLVESISESLSTISSIVPTCVTITVPPAQSRPSYIARSHTLRGIATRHLLIALQPRHAEAPHLVEMESNHLVYDSTAQPRQHPVVATRYPLLVSAKSRFPAPSKSKELGFLLLTITVIVVQS